jgi:hypothetical protein
MQCTNFYINEHAAQRMAQRNINAADIAAVLRFGRVLYRTGAEFYFLAERDLPEGLEAELDHLIGTTVIVENGRVATVYRNREALKRIRRKLKFKRAA